MINGDTMSGQDMRKLMESLKNINEEISPETTITVGNLIDRLSKFDRNMKVVITDGYGGKHYDKTAFMLITSYDENGEMVVDIGIGGCGE